MFERSVTASGFKENAELILFQKSFYPKYEKKLFGNQVMNIFNKYKISEYIVSCFEAFHTMGAKYIVEDTDLYIEASLRAQRVNLGCK